jgi:hypothetical protein
LLADPQSSENFTPSHIAIPTGGQVFEDGALIELIDDQTERGCVSLLLWRDGTAVVGPRVEHGGHSYIPLALHPSVRRAVRLPSGLVPITSTADLFAELVAVALRFTGLAETFCSMLAFFIFGSWLADCIPAPINLSLWSSLATECARVLRLLSCLCRQALPLAAASARDLNLLPTELQPTLLIFRPASNRRTIEVLSTYGWRGFHVARAGELGVPIGSVGLSTDAPLKDRILDPMLEIPIAPSGRPLPILDERAQRELANEFLPRLLYYRLIHHAAAVAAGSANASCDGSFCQFVTGIAACFSDEPRLRDEQLRLLAEAGANGHEVRQTDPRVPLIEALWVRCHEHGRDKVYVAEIAADVNAVFATNGDVELSSRMVGGLIRSLGVGTCKIDRKGRGIKFDRQTRRLIHQLARVHDVPSAERPLAGCAECSQGQPSGT